MGPYDNISLGAGLSRGAFNKYIEDYYHSPQETRGDVQSWEQFSGITDFVKKHAGDPGWQGAYNSGIFNLPKDQWESFLKEHSDAAIRSHNMQYPTKIQDRSGNTSDFIAENKPKLNIPPVTSPITIASAPVSAASAPLTNLPAYNDAAERAKIASPLASIAPASAPAVASAPATAAPVNNLPNLHQQEQQRTGSPLIASPNVGTGVNSTNVGLMPMSASSGPTSNFSPNIGTSFSSNISPSTSSNIGGGRTLSSNFGASPAPANNPVNNAYGAYDTSVRQGSQDYDKIMEMYKNFLSGSQIYSPQKFQQSTYTPLAAPTPIRGAERIDPQQAQFKPMELTPFNPGPSPERMVVTGATYQQNPDVIAGLSRLKNLVDTGGYTPEGIADIRERGISPIRSVYANAQRNVDRSRALSGGYSPNFNAVSAKMAREMADVVGNQTTNVNAGIAQNVAANKLSAAPAYSAAAQAQSELQNLIERENAAAKMRIGEFNANATNQYNQRNAEINAARESDVNRYNTSGLNETNRYNTEGMNRAAEMNAMNRMMIDRYNTEGVNSANRENWQNANETNRYNSMGANETNRFNAGMQSGDRSQQLEALRGMLGLFSAIPGFASMFGNQALGTASLQNTINQQNRNFIPGLLGMFN